MSLLFATLKIDVQLQARSKLYTIGIVVAVMLGLAGRFFVHPDYAGRLLAVFYLTGLGGTTYFFGASLVLFEKSEGTLQALRTTPLTSTAYIASKVITLTSFAVLESAIVYAIAFFGVPLNLVPMLLGVVCLGVIYTLVGLGHVASCHSITAFLFPGAVLVTGVLQLPTLCIFLGSFPPGYLIPTQGSLLLMLGAAETLEVWQWAYAIVASLLSMALAFWWAKQRFAQFIGLQEG
jgi:fluoroquinolone transport system permease protein